MTGEQLKNKRVEAGLSLKELSNAYGFPAAYFAVIENGIRTTTEQEFSQIIEWIDRTTPINKLIYIE